MSDFIQYQDNITGSFYHSLEETCTKMVTLLKLAQNNTFVGLVYNLLFKPSGFFSSKCYLGSKTSIW